MYFITFSWKQRQDWGLYLQSNKKGEMNPPSNLLFNRYITYNFMIRKGKIDNFESEAIL